MLFPESVSCQYQRELTGETSNCVLQWYLPGRDIGDRAVDQVVLDAGATRAPLARRLVANLFGRMPAMQLDPDRVVALGAAVQAGLKARDEALREVVLTDVCPHTLGIETKETVETFMSWHPKK